MDLNKLQNEYEQKLDNQEKSIQDIQEKSEELSTERIITKARFHPDRLRPPGSQSYLMGRPQIWIKPDEIDWVPSWKLI